MIELTQLEIFDQVIRPKTEKFKTKQRDVNAEAKAILDKVGISQMPKEVKALIAAKLMQEYFPELHNLILMSLIA